MDCIFCKIANGEIPSATLYEDEDFRVMLDKNSKCIENGIGSGGTECSTE